MKRIGKTIWKKNLRKEKRKILYPKVCHCLKKGKNNFKKPRSENSRPRKCKKYL